MLWRPGCRVSPARTNKMNTNADHQQVHLIVEPSGHGSASPGRGGLSSAALAVPPGAAWLWPGAGGAPQLGAAKPGGGAHAVLVEQVALWRQPRLLLVREDCGVVRVNGLPAPRFSLLKEQDTLQLDGDYVLHVTIFRRPVIGPPPASWFGKECPVCNVPFKSSSRCYVCFCGGVVHYEISGENPLECAQMRARSGCPACNRPVVLEPGYSYLPDGINEPD
jgi:hypothetical protein